MSYILKSIKGDCNICAKDEIDLISPNKYDEIECNHFICEECWKNIGKIKPICPMCQRDISSWMVKFMKFEISTEMGYDPFIPFEEFIENNDGISTPRHRPFMYFNFSSQEDGILIERIPEVEEPDSENRLNSAAVMQITGNDTFYVGSGTVDNSFIPRNSGDMSTARYAEIASINSFFSRVYIQRFLEVEEEVDYENFLTEEVMQITGNDRFYVRNGMDRRTNHLALNFDILNRISNMISEHLINNIIEMIDAEIFRSVRDTENRNQIQGISFNTRISQISGRISRNIRDTENNNITFLPLNENKNGISQISGRISRNGNIFSEIKKASAFLKGSQSKKNKISEKYKEKNKKIFTKNNKKRYNYKTNIHNWR